MVYRAKYPQKLVRGIACMALSRSMILSRRLEKQDIKVDKRMILLREPIKKTGTQKIPIRIYTDVEPVIEVEVVPE